MTKSVKDVIVANANSVMSSISSMRSNDKAGAKRQIEDMKRKLAALNATDVLTEAAFALAGKPMPGAQQPARRQINELTNDIFEETATRVAQDKFMKSDDYPTNRFVDAAPSSSKMRPVLRGEWMVEAITQESRSGKEQIRYQVRSKMGIIPDKFRHKVVAEMVAAALEQTGGKLSDQRIDKIRALCEQETSLMTEIVNLKRLMETTDPGNEKRMGGHQAKLESAKRRLREIRNALGVG